MLGIDLGTTNARVGIIAEGVPILAFDTDGDQLAPSIVSYAPKLAVGKDAIGPANADPTCAVRGAKRLLGLRSDHPRVTRLVDAGYLRTSNAPDAVLTLQAGTKSLSPEAIVATIFGYLRHWAERLVSAPANCAVLSVAPAFDKAQKSALGKAASQAWLPVARTIMDPTAVALAVTMNATEEMTIAVVDVGGGGTSVGILRAGQREVELLGGAGQQRVGGQEVDDAVLSLILDDFARAGAPPPDSATIREQLRQICVALKHDLSESSWAQRELPGMSPGAPTAMYPLGRDRFEVVLSDLQAHLRACIRAGLDAAGRTAAEVPVVYLTGGMSAVPAIRDEVERAFGAPPICGPFLEGAAAVGAVRLAASISGALDPVTVKEGECVHDVQPSDADQIAPVQAAAPAAPAQPPSSTSNPVLAQPAGAPMAHPLPQPPSSTSNPVLAQPAGAPMAHPLPQPPSSTSNPVLPPHYGPPSSIPPTPVVPSQPVLRGPPHGVSPPPSSPTNPVLAPPHSGPSMGPMSSSPPRAPSPLAGAPMPPGPFSSAPPGVPYGHPVPPGVVPPYFPVPGYPGTGAPLPPHGMPPGTHPIGVVPSPLAPPAPSGPPAIAPSNPAAAGPGPSAPPSVDPSSGAASIAVASPSAPAAPSPAKPSVPAPAKPSAPSKPPPNPPAAAKPKPPPPPSGPPPVIVSESAVVSATRRGRFTNPARPRDLLALQLSPDKTKSAAGSISLAALLLHLSRRSASGTLKLDGPTGSIKVGLSKGRIYFIDADELAVMEAFKARAGAYDFDDNKPSTEGAKWSSMERLVAKGLRTIGRRFEADELQQALGDRIDLAPDVDADRKADVGRLGLTANEERMARAYIIGRESALKIATSEDSHTGLVLLFILEAFGCLEWREAQGRRRGVVATRLKRKARRMQLQSHFEILDVHWSAQEEEIKAAYDRVMEECKPGGEWDLVAAEACKEMRQHINGAWKVLSDPHARDKYMRETLKEVDFQGVSDLISGTIDSYQFRGASREAAETRSKLKRLRRTLGTGKKMPLKVPEED